MGYNAPHRWVGLTQKCHRCFFGINRHAITCPCSFRNFYDIGLYDWNITCRPTVHSTKNIWCNSNVKKSKVQTKCFEKKLVQIVVGKTHCVFSANCIIQKLKYKIYQSSLVQTTLSRYYRADNINWILKCKLHRKD